MAKVIQAIQVKIYRYSPDLKEDYYIENQVQTLEDAVNLDKLDYDNGRVSLDELVSFPPDIKTTWEIVDDGLPNDG